MINLNLYKNEMKRFLIHLTEFDESNIDIYNIETHEAGVIGYKVVFEESDGKKFWVEFNRQGKILSKGMEDKLL